MEFYGTDLVIKIVAPQVPWNSMNSFFNFIETFASSKLQVLNLARIPWILSFPILIIIIFNFAGWINFRK